MYSVIQDTQAVVAGEHMRNLFGHRRQTDNNDRLKKVE